MHRCMQLKDDLCPLKRCQQITDQNTVYMKMSDELKPKTVMLNKSCWFSLVGGSVKCFSNLKENKMFPPGLFLLNNLLSIVFQTRHSVTYIKHIISFPYLHLPKEHFPFSFVPVISINEDAVQLECCGCNSSNLNSLSVPHLGTK